MLNLKFKDIGATIIIDLTKTIEELWSSIDEKARKGIKRANLNNLIFEELKSQEEMNDLYEIFKETAKYGGFDESSWEGLKSKNPIYFVVKKNGNIIAGIGLWKKSDDRLRLCMNCSKKEFLEFQPNNLIYWESIIYAKKNKYKIFDLGGYQLNANPNDKLYYVNKFKEKWGGNIEIEYFYSKNPIKIVGRKIVRNFKFARRINNLIKKYIAKF